MRVALVLAVVGDLRGSGGAERQFSQLHEHFRANGGVETVLVTARGSLGRLRTAGRLQDATGVESLPLGDPAGRGRLGVMWMTAGLLWATLRGGFDVVHLCLPTPAYLPYAAVLSRLPRAWRPLVSLTVIDCTVAPNLVADQVSDRYEQQVLEAHYLFFRWSRIDGVFSWYQAFVETARKVALVPEATLLRAARFCFTDTTRFSPSTTKRQTIVFAGRLSVQKRPLLFVEAVASFCKRYPALARDWRFEMYGGGAQEAEVRRRLADLQLADAVSLRAIPDLSAVFAASRLLVSTQAIENFTSLAMLEAMAAGNAVIAQDTGQTGDFLRHGENGFLVAGADPDAFADAIAQYVSHPEMWASMAAASRRLATEVHTVEHFAADIEAFWADMVKGDG